MHPSSPTTVPQQTLGRALLLALAALTSGHATARHLDNESEWVGEHDPAEAWSLVNGSVLLVMNGTALEIAAKDMSLVGLEGSTVRSSGNSTPAVSLAGRSELEAWNSHFHGGVTLETGALGFLAGGSIQVTAAGLAPDETSSVGIDIGAASPMDFPTGMAFDLAAASLRVEDAPAATSRFESGIGVRMRSGRTGLSHGSQVDAANIGVLMWGTYPAAHHLRLGIDASTVRSGRGAAIEVVGAADNTYDITVANGSRLYGGDGNLLRVGTGHGTVTARTDVTFRVDDSRLAGNITFDQHSLAAGSMNVVLRNSARIDGRFFNVTSADIDNGSTWLLTGDSNVGHLQLGSSGRIALGDGTTFNALTVDSFNSDGGTLQFHTALGDDTSASDRFIIHGDASGQANVRVFNAGGAGAKTDKGIELIRVGGASNARFDLQGRAVGGQYEYFLFKDAANGGWYLRSVLMTPPDPCETDPALPGCAPVDPVDPINPIDPIDPIKPIDPIDPITPPPVLRPETGAYLAHQFALDQLLRHSARDRQDVAAEGVRGWAQVSADNSQLAAVNHQLDLRVQRSRLQLGADLGVFDNGRARVGIMAAAAQADAQSRSQLTGYSARGKVQGGALGVYAGWTGDALYVDGNVQRGQFRNHVQGEGLAEERYDADLWQSSLEAGYRFRLGRAPVSLTPEMQLIHTDRRIDTHTEANGTVVRSLGNSGLSGRVGLRVQGEGRAVGPYVMANVYRDGGIQGLAFDDEAMRASVPRNRYELSAGANLQLQGGLRAWGGLGVMRGDHGYREASANLGVAYRW